MVAAVDADTVEQAVDGPHQGDDVEAKPENEMIYGQRISDLRTSNMHNTCVLFFVRFPF